MADTLFVNATATVPGTPIVAPFMNDANTAIYDRLTAVAGTNTITATGPLSMSAYAAGQNFWLVPAVTNTGATTINISGLGARNITKNGAAALVAGDLVAGTAYELFYDGSQFQVTAPSAFDGTLPIVNGGTGATTGAQALINLGATGRLIGVQRFTANGTYTPTTGTTSVIVHAVGGGGGGGGATVTGGAQISSGSGGGAGGYTIGRFTSAFSGLAVTIGAGGTGVSAGNGNTGGTTSLGAIITALGGGGGFVVGASATNRVGGGSGAAASGTGGNILATAGASGMPVVTGISIGNPGAAGPFGGTSGTSVNANGDNAPVSAYGSGGGGASNDASLGTPRTGGTGGSGIVIVYEYS